VLKSLEWIPTLINSEIGFTREVSVLVNETLAPTLTFGALNTSNLAVSVSSQPALPGTVKLEVTPLASGTPTIVVTHSATGTVLATQEVEEFDLSTQAD